MATNEWKKLPGQSITYLLICGAILLAFIFIAIIPSQKSLNSLDGEREDLKAQIVRQKILFPLYRDLLSKMQLNVSEAMLFPARSQLGRNKMDEISSVFGEMAQKSNLDIVHITPDAKSITKGAELLMVNAFLKGDFFDFRKFLIELGGVPYLEFIEEIQIQSVPGTREFRLRFWLALGK